MNISLFRIDYRPKRVFEVSKKKPTWDFLLSSKQFKDKKSNNDFGSSSKTVLITRVDVMYLTHSIGVAPWHT
jgi:hypothetical protein